MGRNSRAEVEVTDASAPLRHGVVRLVRKDDAPHQVQLQLEFPKDVSAVAVVNMDELFLAMRTIMPEYNVLAQPALLPSMFDPSEEPNMLLEEDGS